MRLIIGLLCLFLLPVPTLAQEVERRVTVTGEGQVSAAPDMATVQLGVQVSEGSADAAMRRNSARMQAIFAALEEAGIKAKDIQTSGLSLFPQYRRSNNGEAPQIAGYTASNSVAVTVRALAELGGVLDTLTEAGANQINGVNFGIQDPAPLEAEARKAAVADARARAELYTQAAGVTLGDVITISEVRASVSGPIPMAMARSEAMESAVPIAEGELAISARITIVYALN